MIVETRVLLLQFIFVRKLMALMHSRDYHAWNQITVLNQYLFSYILICQSISNLSLLVRPCVVRGTAENALFNLCNIFKYWEYIRCLQISKPMNNNLSTNFPRQIYVSLFGSNEPLNFIIKWRIPKHVGFNLLKAL